MMTPHGKKISEIRKSKNLTQEQLEAISGVDQRTISQIEVGSIQNPSAEICVKLARAMNVNVEDFFQQESPLKGEDAKLDNIAGGLLREHAVDKEIANLPVKWFMDLARRWDKDDPGFKLAISQLWKKEFDSVVKWIELKGGSMTVQKRTIEDTNVNKEGSEQAA